MWTTALKCLCIVLSVGIFFEDLCVEYLGVDNCFEGLPVQSTLCGQLL